MGEQARSYLLDEGWIPAHLESAYETLTTDLLQQIHEAFDAAQGVTELRLHGDCHRGNVLWTDSGPHFVDLDDCITGPAIQDLWMLLSGSRAEMGEQLAQLLEGYSQFADFDMRGLVLIESLRTLRMIHYSSWLARRWTDPAFPAAFPLSLVIGRTKCSRCASNRRLSRKGHWNFAKPRRRTSQSVAIPCTVPIPAIPGL
jgi:Ser/Thr protein kinase RdoA (MazF antagonist)